MEKETKAKLVIEAVVQVLAVLIVALLIAGFVISIFYLMGAASAIEVLRYGFATVAFSVMLPSFAVSYRRKS